MSFQAAADGFYLGLGRAVAQVFGRFDFVESVFLRRTTASGGVTFGRSDIDLTVVVSSPMMEPHETDKMVRLLYCRQALKGLVPVLGECEVGTREELARSYIADPYRASVDRQTAVTVYGEPFEIPNPPIRPEDALTWVAIWYAYYLPLAMAGKSRRNMRKFALEMWNAARTATGDVDQPYPTREKAEQAWREASGESFPLRAGDSVEQLFGVCNEVAAEAHSRLCPPLGAIDEPVIHKGRSSGWALVPASQPCPSDYSKRRFAFLGCPEALDLYVRHVGPRSFQGVPQPVLDLGIRGPGQSDWLDCLRRFICEPRMLRRPGFVYEFKLAHRLPEQFLAGREAARELRAGRMPVWKPIVAEELKRSPPTYREYYASVLPDLYPEILAVWEDLDHCDPAR